MFTSLEGSFLHYISYKLSIIHSDFSLVDLYQGHYINSLQERGYEMENQNLDDLNLDGVDFSNLKLVEISMRKASLRNANFSKSTFID